MLIGFPLSRAALLGSRSSFPRAALPGIWHPNAVIEASPMQQGSHLSLLRSSKSMAQPISLDVPTHPHQVELLQRLGHAPEQHAAALLAGLDLLQALHDEGVLDLLRGAVSARGKLSERLASAAGSTESIRSLRNLFLMGRMLSSIDPETMRRIAAAVEETVGPGVAPEHEVPRLVSLLGYFRHRYLRRSLALVVRFLGALGRQLTPQTSQAR